MRENELVPLDDSHRRVLNAIWQAFQAEKSWPTYLGVSKQLYEEGLDLKTLIEAMPSGLMWPDPKKSQWVWAPRDGDEMRVTLARALGR